MTQDASRALIGGVDRSHVMDYLLPDNVYQILKWAGLILMPALAALIGAVGPAWGLPNVDAVVLTLNAVGTFIGVVIGASQVSAMGRVDRSWDIE